MSNRYTNIKEFTNKEGKTYKTNVIYPSIPLSENDYYIISTAEDRYDLLAQHFYNDYSLWWVIASANSTEAFSLNIRPGIQIRIPASISQALELYEKLNSNR